eukprot:7767255-Alexandrium_andersonii.AAC.1
MSASLVGSEMCIRDSHRAVGPRQRGRDVVVRDHGQLPEEPAPAEERLLADPEGARLLTEARRGLAVRRRRGHRATLAAGGRGC